MFFLPRNSCSGQRTESRTESRRSRAFFSLLTPSREVESGRVAPRLLLPRHLSLLSPGLQVSSADPWDTAASWKMEVKGRWGNSASSGPAMSMFWVRFPLTVCSLRATCRQPLLNHQPFHFFKCFPTDFCVWMLNKLARKKTIKKKHQLLFSCNTVSGSLCPSWHHKVPWYLIDCYPSGVTPAQAALSLSKPLEAPTGSAGSEKLTSFQQNRLEPTRQLPGCLCRFGKNELIVIESWLINEDCVRSLTGVTRAQMQWNAHQQGVQLLCPTIPKNRWKTKLRSTPTVK